MSLIKDVYHGSLTDELKFEKGVMYFTSNRDEAIDGYMLNRDGIGVQKGENPTLYVADITIEKPLIINMVDYEDEDMFNTLFCYPSEENVKELISQGYDSMLCKFENEIYYCMFSPNQVKLKEKYIAYQNDYDEWELGKKIKINEEIVYATSKNNNLVRMILKNPTRKELRDNGIKYARIVEDDYGVMYFANAEEYSHIMIATELQHNNITDFEYNMESYNFGFNVLLYDCVKNIFYYRADYMSEDERKEILENVKYIFDTQYFHNSFGDFSVDVSNKEEPWMNTSTSINEELNSIWNLSWNRLDKKYGKTKINLKESYNKDVYEQIVYAGSGVQYDTPSLNAVGSNTGDAVHGYGLYYSKNPKIAKKYRNISSGTQWLYNGKPFLENIGEYTDGDLYWFQYELPIVLKLQNATSSKELVSILLKDLNQTIKSWEGHFNTSGLKKFKEMLQTIDLSKLTKKDEGMEITVDVPNDEYLLSEASFESQSPYVKQCLKNMVQAEGMNLKELKSNYSQYLTSASEGSIYQYVMSFLSGKRRYELSGDEERKYQKMASEMLYKYGIKGIRYNGKNDGRCVVIFNSEDVKVVGRNLNLKESKLLTEDIAAIKKYFPKIHPSDFNNLINYDPTYQGGNELGKYGKWILSLYNNYIKDQIAYKKWEDQKNQGNNYPEPIRKSSEKIEDFEKLPNLLRQYDVINNKVKNDISNIKSISDLYSFVDTHKSQGISDNSKVNHAKDLVKKSVKKGGEIVFQNNNWIVLIPKTLESSVVFGNDTNWCTTSPNGEMYKEYKNRYGGEYFINVNLKNGDLYQFHFESEQFMDSSDEDIGRILDFLNYEEDLFNFYANYSEKTQLGLLDACYEEHQMSNVFEHIKNPSEKIQMEVIKFCPYCIKYIENPSEKIQMEVIKNKPYFIQYIENPSEKVQIEAMKFDCLIIQYIKNPSEELQMKAVKEEPGCIKYIENPSENVQMTAVKEAIKRHIHIVRICAWIKNPTPKVKEYIEKIKNVKESKIPNLKVDEKKFKSSISNVLLESKQLNEGIEELRKYYPKIDTNILDKLIKLDPTYRGGNQLGNYGKWILNLYNNFLKDKIAQQKWEDQKKMGKEYPQPIRKSQEQIEDFDKLPAILKDFEVINKKLKVNINTIKSIADLYKVVNDAKNQGISDNSKVNHVNDLVKKSVSKGGKVVFKDSNWIVLVPETLESSVVFGNDTNWCTTSPNGEMYDYYKKRYGGQYFININLQTGDLYQFHFESEQCMDKNDKQIQIEQIIGNDIKLKKFYLNYLYNHCSKNVNFIYIIKLDDNPSEQVQLEAVKRDGYNIRYIKNPTEKIQLLAVKRDGYNIRYIKNPTEQVQLLAVKENGFAIDYIENPTEQVQLTAVKENGFAIQYIINPLEQVQLAAVKKNGDAIEYIENPSEQVQLAAVKKNGDAIEYIENPSEQVQLAAIKKNGDAIQYIENPTEKIQLVAVKKSGDAIQYIKNPSEQIQLAAVQYYGFAIQYIKNPTDKVKELYKKLYVKIKNVKESKIPSLRVDEKKYISSIFDVLLESNILTEDIEAVKKYFPKVPEDKIQTLIELDPTYQGGDNLGKFGKWILGLYNKGKLKDEDFYKVPQYLTTFKDNLKKIANKDIMSYKNLPELALAIQEFEGQKDVSNKQKIKLLKNNEAEKILETAKWLIINPKTHRADCYYGANTKWCTASKDDDTWFNNYNDKGPLFILINKSKNKKYQFHFETLSFMNELDSEIKPSEVIGNDNEVINWFYNQVSDKLETIIENHNEEYYEQIEFGGYNGYAYNVDIYTLLSNCVEFSDENEELEKMITDYIETDSINTFSSNLIRKLLSNNTEFAEKCNDLVKYYSPNDYYMKYEYGKYSGLFTDKIYRNRVFRKISYNVWDKIIKPLWEKINEESISFEIDDNRIMIDVKEPELIESIYYHGDFKEVFNTIENCEKIEFSSLNITTFDFIFNIVYSSIKEWFTEEENQLEFNFEESLNSWKNPFIK